ncbi:MAG: OmpA family protein [Xanthomonadales bacterium]|nr:OmpA family protein [Gammaproteobacteria bacterium]NNE04746.1 OmpA family protein [Xanthomonadales bacterium]NNL96017.1 OmpA family protein [Xanthomonadales bacterium]
MSMDFRTWVLASLALLLAGCAAAPKKDLALERVRSQLESLKADDTLGGYAPLALGEAERALRTAEQATGNEVYRFHLVYMADRRIQIARAMAQREQLEQTLDELNKSRNDMQVRASQIETERAREEAEQARLMFAATAEEAERQRREKEQALQQGAESARTAELAIEEAAQARRLAESRASEIELARREAELASQEVDSLKRQLENLQLRQTESGVVVTLGDVLFGSGETTLLDSAHASLVEVVDLLQTEPDKLIRIEGHTDSVGAAETNQALSEQRALAVRDALVGLGVDASRVTTIGLGEDFPIASNDDADGRARNRRVDVILLDNS